MGEKRQVQVFLQVVEGVTEEVGTQRGLLEGFIVHEVVKSALFVEILDITALEAGSTEPFTGLEGALDGMTGPDVLEL